MLLVIGKLTSFAMLVMQFCISCSSSYCL